MRQICHEHCPGSAGGQVGAALVAAAVGLVALAGFAWRYAVVLIIGLNAVALVTFGLYRAALRLTVLLWHGERTPLAIDRSEAAAAVDAATAPLAIEAPKRVVISFTDVREGSVER